MACAGHGMGPGERRGRRERDSTRSRLSIGTSTPSARPGRFPNRLVCVNPPAPTAAPGQRPRAAELRGPGCGPRRPGWRRTLEPQPLRTLPGRRGTCGGMGPTASARNSRRPRSATAAWACWSTSPWPRPCPPPGEPAGRRFGRAAALPRARPSPRARRMPPESLTHLWLLPVPVETREGLRWTRGGEWTVLDA
jgi:hypothetical protein